MSIYTVARELGHQSDEMVRRVYARLGSMRHRSHDVEYRVEQHLEKLGDRLRRLGFGTGKRYWRRGRRQERSTPRHRSIDGARSSRVGPARLERATSCSGGKRSIQLSYGPAMTWTYEPAIVRENSARTLLSGPQF